MYRLGRRTQDNAVQHFACCNETPECNEQLARQRNDHCLARATAPVGRSGLKPLGEGVAFLEPKKTPRQSDHAGADASATGAGKTLLAPAFAALIWGAGKAGIASDCLTIAELTREDLV